MPELPEVETVVRDLVAAGLEGARITGVRIHWARTIATPSPARFQRALRGRVIQRLSRRGKFIVIHLSDGGALLVHLRMTGRLLLASPGPHDRVVFALSDGRELRFADPRKFGRIWLADDPATVLASLGPEPLAITPADFRRRLADRTRALKPLLLDQSFLAGIGNIYADEALWAAQLHPLRKSDTLDAPQADRLLRAIRTVLRRGIRNLGTSLGHGKTNFRLPRGESGRNREHLRAYGQTGLPCPRCTTPIARILVAQRATHLCPACQPAPPPPPLVKGMALRGTPTAGSKAPRRD
jgi:formamidopyrimidine-DNA glycosylase